VSLTTLLYEYTPIVTYLTTYVLGIEGLGGDKRLNSPPGRGAGLLTELQRDGGPRLVVVPYFVDRIEHITAVLYAENYTMEGEKHAWTGQLSSSEGTHTSSGLLKTTGASLSSSSSSSDRPLKYHMRADADKGHALRADLVRTFRRVEGAVVGFGKLEDTKATSTAMTSNSSSSLSSYYPRRQAYRHYLELQHALFCLAPKGLTSSAARYDRSPC